MQPIPISIKDARNQFADLINRASLTGETFVITKFNKPRALISGISSLNRPSGLSTLQELAKKPYEGNVPSDLSVNDTYLYEKSV